MYRARKELIFYYWTIFQVEPNCVHYMPIARSPGDLIARNSFIHWAIFIFIEYSMHFYEGCPSRSQFHQVYIMLKNLRDVYMYGLYAYIEYLYMPIRCTISRVAN